MKKAFITGITGQDGSYLAEYLLKLGYEVHGVKRRSSSFNTSRIDHIYQDPHEVNKKFFLYYGDLADSSNLFDLINDLKPDEIYNLGAQSHVRVSFDLPEYTGNITALGTTRILETIRRNKIKTKFYQASSSELFGSALPPQNENTAFEPQSPYAIAKLYAYWMTINYRNAYGIYACNGILFNHESPRRGETFITRKITTGISRILAGLQKCLYLGNLEARRDWGFAPEYMMIAHKLLQLDNPVDLVIGTGESHTIREFVEQAFAYCGIEIAWVGSGLNEVGVVHSISREWDTILKIGDILVKIDEQYFRPTEVNYLLADIEKAKRLLDWEPKVKFDSLVQIMMDFDLYKYKVRKELKTLNLLQSLGFEWTSELTND